VPPAPPAPPAPVALSIIAAVLSIAALHFGRAFFIPVALALAFHALLRPVVRGLEGLRIPSALGAAMVVLGGLGIAAAGGWVLSGPVVAWVDKAPASFATARARLETMVRPIDRLTDAAAGNAVAPAPAPPGRGGPSLLSQLLGEATTLVIGLVEVLVLLYLMLAAGNSFLKNRLHHIESIVAHYLTLNAIINAGEGLVVGLAMWAIGMPDPLVWGLLTFALEFIPYVGAAGMLGLLLISSLTTFTHTGHALVAPAIYLVITTLQNNVVSPYVYGGRLKLNPLAVVLCVMFWWFIWGIPGVFLAIPIAATLKALGDQVPRLAPLGEFLGE
jgi:predicted PurR-regulated permease PerM